MFLAASDLQEPRRQVTDRENYELAFYGIQRTPVRAFDRGQRNKILDSVLRSLTSINLHTSVSLDHINLLIEYLSLCNNPSRVLSMIQKDSTEEPLKLFPVEKSPLLELVRRLDRDQGEMSKIPLMKALRRLGHLTLRYETRTCRGLEASLIEKRRCISTISQEKSVERLASFYHQLGNACMDGFETPLHYALTTILETSLSIYVHHISEFPESLRAKAERVKVLRQHHADFVRGCLFRIDGDKSSMERPSVRSEMFILLEGMISYSDLLTHPNLGEGMYF